METNSVNAIPGDVALRLCQEIREANRGRWWAWTAWWCWCCEKFCKGDPAKMCFSNHPGYRGCAQVNARYDQQARLSNSRA